MVIGVSTWVKPTAWERVLHDDELETPLVGKWVNTGVANVSSANEIIIPMNTMMTGGGFTYQTGQTQLNSFSYGFVRQNYAEPSRPWGVGWRPYPRNHKEKRIAKSIERRLPELLRKAEKKFGPIGEGLESEWNDSFWRMVTLDAKPDHFLKTKK